jgi:hypothetical protein
MEKIIYIIIFIVAIFSIKSCSNAFSSFTIKNNQAFYIHWTEGTGKNLMLIPNVDLKTFKEIKNEYAKDKNNVIFRDKVLKNSNPSSFKILNSDFAIDNNFAYFYGDSFRISGKFEIIYGIYSKDEKNIFHGNTPMDKYSYGYLQFR